MRISEIIAAPIPSPLYHGTSAEFDRFEPGRSVRSQTSLGGFSFTSDQRYAYTYASSAARITGGKPRVLTANLTMRNPLDITAAIKNGQRRKMTFGDAKRAALSKFDPQIHDGIIFRGNGQNPDEYVVFDPDQINILGKAP